MPFQLEEFLNTNVLHKLIKLHVMKIVLHRITRLIYWEKYDEAEEIAQSIVVLDKWESCLRLAEIYFQRGDFVRAQFCVNKILSSNEDEKNHLRMDMQIRAKLILLDVQCMSSHLSGTVPLGMLTLLNSTLAQAEDYHLDYHALVVKMKMANVNLLMRMPSQAIHILDGCLAQMLSHGSLYDRARSKFLHARCLVAEANHSQQENRSNILKDVTEILESVRDDFELLQIYSKVKDVYFMQVSIETFLHRCDIFYLWFFLIVFEILIVFEKLMFLSSSN